MIRRYAKKGSQGFTLIELMIVVAIVGILAVLAVYGVRRYISNAKSAEARNAIGAISQNAAAAYERETTAAGNLALGATSTFSHQFCVSEAATVPAAPPQGQKYQSKPSDWLVGAAANTGFACLKFSMDQPQYFAYGYTSDSTAATAGTNFTATAQGDIVGAGAAPYWTFTTTGAVDPTSNSVRISPSITETNAE